MQERDESIYISIHAPPRGATSLGALLKTEREKFQFTPLREGRRTAALYCGERRKYFNSRPSARGDLNLLILLVRHNISIHAPPRGATWTIEPQDERKLISIHAPPRGATPTKYQRPSSLRFQFTPLREGRRLI